MADAAAPDVRGARSSPVGARTDPAVILGRTRIDWELSDDVERSLWEKLVFLSVLSGMQTSLFRGNVREIMAAPGGREAMINHSTPRSPSRRMKGIRLPATRWISRASG